MPQSIEIHPIAGLGAELRGLDLRKPLGDASIDTVLESLYRCKVISSR